jgi:hypothetical protein
MVRNGSPTGNPAKADIKYCSIDGCSREHSAKGMCKNHYQMAYELEKKTRTTQCSVDECTDIVDMRGLCQNHYRRYLLYGSPLGGTTPNGMPIRFIMKAIVECGSECIIWPYSVGGKYGLVSFNGKQTTAHRVALELAKGPPEEDGLDACHDPILCSSSLCINPNHLRWDSRKNNVADKEISGTQLRGEEIWKAKLTKQDIMTIKSDTRIQRDIAKEFNVSPAAICLIKKGKRWKHVI